jgi:dUTP pyrophosphatase
MQVKVKKLHPNAVIPKYAKEGDAGLDLTAISLVEKQSNLVYGTGLAIEIPQGYVGLLFPRSSLTNYDLSLGNHVGVIDSGFRGEIIFKFKMLDFDRDIGPKSYNVGDRIGQLLIIPYPKVELIEAEELSSSERGTGSYGSSGA